MRCSGIRRIMRASKARTTSIYTGAAPNQHIIPLIEYLLPHHGDRAFCVGSNYIWAWENNRILRETVIARGRLGAGERYFPVGETDFDQVIEAIIEARPSFVFSTLIGTSAYQFFRDFRAACRARRHRSGRARCRSRAAACRSRSWRRSARRRSTATSARASISARSSPANAALPRSAYHRALPGRPGALRRCGSGLLRGHEAAWPRARIAADTDDAAAIKAVCRGKNSPRRKARSGSTSRRCTPT